MTHLNSTKSVSIFIILFFIFSTLSANEYMFKHLEVKDGLSNNQINHIFKDSEGYMWFSTASGLNRYDGNQVKIFRSYDIEKGPLPDNYVYDVQEDIAKNLWIRTEEGYSVYIPETESFDKDIRARMWDIGIDGIPNLIYIDNHKNIWCYMGYHGVYSYNNETKSTSFISFKDENIEFGEIMNISECADGVLFIFNSGIVVCIDIINNNKKWIINEINKEIGSDKFEFFASFTDKDEDIWIYGPLGIWIYDYKNKVWNNNLKKYIREYSSNKMIRTITQDIDGLIWIGKDQDGIDIINKENGHIVSLNNCPDDERSLQNNTICSIYADRDKSMWVGTFKKGLSYYNESAFKFDINHIGDINCFEEDKNGIIWLGTNDGGLIKWNYKSNKKEVYTSSNTKNLNANVIVSLLKTHDGKLWIGTFWGGLSCYDNGKFINYMNKPGDKNSLANNNIWALTEDKKGNIWIGTLGCGIQKFNPKSGEFKTYNISTHGLPSDHVSSFFITKDNNMLIGTSRGIAIMDLKTEKITNISGTKSGTKSFSNMSINHVIEDSRGLIWIATRDLLNIYNPKNDELKIIKLEDGLSNQYVAGIVEDNNKNMWVSTARGVTNIIVETDGKNNYKYHCFPYDHKDGLLNCEFNQRSILKLSSGEILIGGLYGISGVSSGTFRYNKTEPNVIFTNLSLFNEEVVIGEKYDNNIILEKAINHTQSITLKFHQNIFSIQFSSDNYVLPEKMKYSYMLEGFHNEWLTTNIGKATFTNLAPGKYKLKVKATNNDGYSSSKISTLNIIISPPFWQTGYAYFLYAVCLILFLFIARYIILRIERNKYKIKQIENEALRNQELNDMKLRFFTNVSHDLRTPLTLILTPLDALIKEHKTDDNLSDKLKMIQRNGIRLLNLVNQLLDFRKGDVNGHQLNLSDGDIIEYINLICKSFGELSESKNVHLTFFSSIPSLTISFDEDKIGKVIMNLLSNAFKFTPKDGRVDVSVEVIKNLENEVLEIKFSDTGIGISDNDKTHIFDRFYQVDHPHNSGSGIGLNIVKDFVKLHEGTIEVYDNIPSGSLFIIHLPIRKPVAIENSHIEDNKSEIIDENISDSDVERKTATKKPQVLIVDDNDDFLTFLYDSLSKKYDVKIAINGKEAWEMIPEYMPDIIISDVMMPDMDGKELCRLVKSNDNTAHIPLILLSARHSDEYKLEGLKLGCDDYITKPFNLDILNLKMQKLINLHNKHYRSKIDPSPSEIKITSMDEKLIESAVKYVENNISRSELSVEELSQELGMSRVHLYKKLLAITNKTPIEFIRVIRLKRAAQLLRESQQNVSEIAYQVGFNNPKYFSKYFREEFGELPSTYQERQGK